MGSDSPQINKLVPQIYFALSLLVFLVLAGTLFFLFNEPLLAILPIIAFILTAILLRGTFGNAEEFEETAHFPRTFFQKQGKTSAVIFFIWIFLGVSSIGITSLKAMEYQKQALPLSLPTFIAIFAFVALFTTIKAYALKRNKPGR